MPRRRKPAHLVLIHGRGRFSFDRPPPESMAWVDDGSNWQDADMWATADQSSDYLIGLYQRTCAHADETI